MKLLIIFAISVFAIILFDFSRESISYTNIKVIDSDPQPYVGALNYRSHSSLDLMERALLITKNRLSFDLSSKGNSSVSKINLSNRAHCVGYANFYNSAVNHLFAKNGFRNYTIEHIRASVCFLGINLTNIIPDKRFVEHDVCRITNKLTGEVFIVDPSLSEIFGTLIVRR